MFSLCQHFGWTWGWLPQHFRTAYLLQASVAFWALWWCEWKSCSRSYFWAGSCQGNWVYFVIKHPDWKQLTSVGISLWTCFWLLVPISSYRCWNMLNLYIFLFIADEWIPKRGLARVLETLHKFDLQEVYGEVTNPGYAYAYANHASIQLKCFLMSVLVHGFSILQRHKQLLPKLAEMGYRVTWNDLRTELTDYVRQAWIWPSWIYSR